MSRRFCRARSGSAKPVAPERDQARQLRAVAARRRPLGEERGERVMDGVGDRAVTGAKGPGGGGRPAADAEAPRHEPQRHRLARQRVGLQLVEQLQPVLDGAQMHERVREGAPELGRQVAALGEPEQRLERVALAQPGVVAAVEELQRLHDELDLADAAAAELDVAGAPVTVAAPGQLPIDLALHAANRRHHAFVEPLAIDDPARQVHELRADPLVAGRHARLEQRLALPRRRALAVVGVVALERECDRAHAPLGPQSHVDPEDVALVGHRLDDLDDLAAHARRSTRRWTAGPRALRPSRPPRRRRT